MRRPAHAPLCLAVSWNRSGTLPSGPGRVACPVRLQAPRWGTPVVPIPDWRGRVKRPRTKCERLSNVSIVILKVTLAPCLILLASLAGRRRGPGVGGWVTGLPLTSGPVSLLLALEHGPDFATRAALGTLFGVVSHTVFCVAYSRVAGPVNWPASVAAGSGAFLASTLMLKDVAVPVPVAFVFLCLVLAAGVVAMPRPSRRAGGRRPGCGRHVEGSGHRLLRLRDVLSGRRWAAWPAGNRVDLPSGVALGAWHPWTGTRPSSPSRLRTRGVPARVLGRLVQTSAGRGWARG
jgi:hypothetical protein